MPMPTTSIPIETQHTSRRLVWHHCSPGHAALYVQLLEMSAGRRRPLLDAVTLFLALFRRIVSKDNSAPKLQPQRIP